MWNNNIRPKLSAASLHKVNEQLSVRKCTVQLTLRHYNPTNQQPDDLHVYRKVRSTLHCGY